MGFIFAIAVGVAILLAWSLWGRDWLKAQDWGWSNAFFAFFEPIEAKLWKNSKTIFIARLKMLVGLLTTLATQLGGIDITPLMPFVPEKWHGAVQVLWNMIPLTLTLLGWMDEHLRNQTTQPIETVALTEVEKQKPEVAAAVAKLDEAKAEAVAVVEVAKAQEAT